MDAIRASIGVGGDELSEDCGGAAVVGGVADVVLHCSGAGSINDKFLRIRVVGGGGLQRLHVRAVTTFGHGKTTGDGEVSRTHDPLAVAFGAELIERAAPQAPLHAGLDGERAVDAGKRLERGHGVARVGRAAVGLLESLLEATEVAHGREVGEGVRAVLLEGGTGQRVERRIIQELAGRSAELRVGAVQEGLELGRDGGIGVDGQARGAVGLRPRGISAGLGGGLEVGTGSSRGGHDGLLR